MKMVWLRFLVLSLFMVLLSARGIPDPPPGARLKFTVGVEGIVYCKSCKLPGYIANIGMSPIPGATAILRCRTNITNAISVPIKTNSEGYFLFQTSQLTSFTSSNCRVYVTNSPLSKCNVPVYPGPRGSNMLKFERAFTVNNGIEYLYSSGAFVFQPKKGLRCP
ncbi:Pollen Ole e 1 allergen and extensin family protein [Rhynchospora pubera]|uniref:Pollen Ole e 1 allergen and extensin family protein n=1 Tax=Rhynchospora pubera TaxID=906938 RepID=A0AAV8EGQ5_9POAL|nr:Pollen Ole e 1 allergen and extensin family protein [Rhynchospora pubera]KAJ4806838.1 Pollen Ole e 1 allergen and extensin family protein [Rhynchospora pubera]